MVKKYVYPTCKCGKEKEIPTNRYCKNCYKNYIINNRVEIIPHKEIKDFIIRVNKNNGMVSLEDIFINLITYYNYIDGSKLYGKTSDQLMQMWQIVKRY